MTFYKEKTIKNTSKNASQDVRLNDMIKTFGI